MKELAAGQTLVMYITKESAISAYKEISQNSIGEPPITAEFLTENDIAAVVNASNNAAAASSHNTPTIGAAAATSEPATMSNLWPSAPTSLNEHSQWNGGSSSSMFSSATSAWSSAGGHLDDHSVSSSDLLGGQSM